MLYLTDLPSGCFRYDGGRQDDLQHSPCAVNDDELEKINKSTNYLRWKQLMIEFSENWDT